MAATQHVQLSEPFGRDYVRLVELHRVHLPGSLNSEDAPIQFVILHPGIVACRPPDDIVNPLQTRNSRF